MASTSEIFDAIRSYAEAYAKLQDIQQRSPMIPKGDQKTGCIGEFYAYLQLQRRYPQATLSYGSHSEKGWDLQVEMGGSRFRVQVKTVSEYSETRTISPIHHGWDELWVIYLDRAFVPCGYWVIADRSVVAEDEVRRGCKCPLPNNPRSGSPSIPFGNNRIEELRQTLNASEVVLHDPPACPLAPGADGGEIAEDVAASLGPCVEVLLVDSPDAFSGRPSRLQVVTPAQRLGIMVIIPGRS